MPRLKNRPPAYRLHKPSGQAIISFRGERHYLGKHGSKASENAYRNFVDQWKLDRTGEQQQEHKEAERQRQQELLGAIPATSAELRMRSKAGSRVCVVEIAKCYVDFAKTYYVKNGHQTREAELVREACIFLSDHFGTVDVVEFGPVALDDLRDAMIDQKDWSRKYINKQCDRIIRMFRWGTSKEIVPSGVTESLRSLKGLKKGRTRARETEPIKPVAELTVKLTLPQLSRVVADMVRFQRLTGCRPGEVCSIRPCDVDRSGDIWQYEPDSHKTEHYDRPRLVFIGPKGQDILRKYLLRADTAFCFSPVEAESEFRAARAATRKTPRKYGNRAGTNVKAVPQRRPNIRYVTSSYRKAIHRACQRAFPLPDGLSPDEKCQWAKGHRWSPNQLRHAAATEIRRTFGLEASQVVLGHSTANITEIYAERDQRLAVTVARKLG